MSELVREISRKNAAAIRNAVRLEKLKQLQKLADNINMEDEDRKEILKRKNKLKAVYRHNAALERLHDSQVRKYVHDNKHIIARKAALEKEKDRAAQIASLPKPSQGILQAVQQKVCPVSIRNENMNQDEIYYPVTTMVKRHHNESVEDGRKAALIQEERLDEQLHHARSLAVEREQVAQIRFKKAIDKELLNRKQVFLPPYKRAEALQDKQRIMEEEFEQFYVGDQMEISDSLTEVLSNMERVERRQGSLLDETSSATMPVANVVQKMEQIQKHLQQISLTEDDTHQEVLAKPEETKDMASEDPSSFQPPTIAFHLKKQITEVLEQKKRIQEQKKQLEDRLQQFDKTSLGGYIFNPHGLPRPSSDLSEALVHTPADSSNDISQNGSKAASSSFATSSPLLSEVKDFDTSVQPPTAFTASRGNLSSELQESNNDKVPQPKSSKTWAQILLEKSQLRSDSDTETSPNILQVSNGTYNSQMPLPASAESDSTVLRNFFFDTTGTQFINPKAISQDDQKAMQCTIQTQKFLSLKVSSQMSSSLPSASPLDGKDTIKLDHSMIPEPLPQKSALILPVIHDQSQSNKSSPVSSENLSLTQYSYTSPEICNEETLPAPTWIDDYFTENKEALR
ncbi:unnamed protein product [Acanthosepion pharaonis]|uniref:Uncharacterized protein n=1 Tax=Acanthosepion pharaonis TaxID=158019 RepID=A0A812CEH4_ACAPH|nr:unnamed protein product [Sepia pharaonis]